MFVDLIQDPRLFAFFIAIPHFKGIKLNVEHENNVAVSLDFNYVNRK